MAETLDKFLHTMGSTDWITYASPDAQVKARQRSNATIEASLRLAEYRGFLQQARVLKSRSGGASLGFERDVRRRAKQALEDARCVAKNTLVTVRDARNSGSIRQAWTDAYTSLQSSGPLNLRNAWQEILSDEPSRVALERAGLRGEVLSQIMDALEQDLPATQVSALHDGIVRLEARGSASAAPHVMTLRAPQTPGRPNTVADLLRTEAFDVVAEALIGDRPVPVRIIASQRPNHPANPLDGVVIGALAMVEELIRHSRKLEDTQLAIHAGADPATALGVLLAVSLILAAVAIVGINVSCEDGGDPDFTCKLFKFLAFLSILGLNVLVCLLNPEGCLVYTIILLPIALSFIV